MMMPEITREHSEEIKSKEVFEGPFFVVGVRDDEEEMMFGDNFKTKEDAIDFMHKVRIRDNELTEEEHQKMELMVIDNDGKKVAKMPKRPELGVKFE